MILHHEFRYSVPMQFICQVFDDIDVDEYFMIKHKMKYLFSLVECKGEGTAIYYLWQG
jgi:hypothetical protein